MKAVTPVIATVMLMLITVGMVGMTYAWFSNMMTTQTEKNIAIPIGGVQCYSNRISVIVTNAGANSNITDDDIVIADINGVSVRNTPFFGGFNTNGLVGYWRFEQSNGSAATNDSSGYGNMGTLTNMNLTGNSTSGPTLGGRFGNALLFDGTDDSVNAGNMGIPTNGPATIEGWFKFNQFAMAKGAHINIHSQLYQHSSNNYFYLGGAGADFFSIGASLSLNTWYHIALTYNGTHETALLYVNGVKYGVAIQTPNSNHAALNPFQISNPTFNGAIDEVQIWNRSLSADEITQLNKTNAGNFTLAPNSAVTLIKGYPVFAKGRYTVRIGTRNGVMERTVECM